MEKNNTDPEANLESNVKYFMQELGYYCSQASFATLQKLLSIECDTSAFIKALRPFPGIALRFETCGAVTGSLIAIGLIHGTTGGDDQGQLTTCLTIADEFCSRFEKEMGSTRCGDIMERQFGRRFNLRQSDQWQEFRDAGSKEKCPEVVTCAVRIAFDLLSKGRSGDHTK